MKRFVLCIFSVALVFTIITGVAQTEGDYRYHHPHHLVGQNDFFDQSINRIDGRGFDLPKAIAIDNRMTPPHLYVADTGNNRVLVWIDIDRAFDGFEADMVLGQENMELREANPGGVAAHTMWSPTAIFVDDRGDLYVCDRDNHRVLIFKEPTQDDALPDAILGQSDFESNQPDAGIGVSNRGFNGPSGVCVDQNHTVYVADELNNRILVFKDPLGVEPAEDDLADYVIGQMDFASNLPNQGYSNPDSDTLDSPAGLALDSSGYLWVADKYNHRILKFNTPITVNEPLAVKQLGQPDFISNYTNWDGMNAMDNSSPYATGLYYPDGISFDSSDRIYIADNFNNRVLRWDANSGSGQAEFVFGQNGNFNTGSPIYPTAADTLNGPTDVGFDNGGRLYIADTYDNRILRFNNPETSDDPDGLGGQGNYSAAEANRFDGASLSFPSDSVIDTSVTPPRLYVVDSGANRVLGWSDVTDAFRGKEAGIILGQVDAFSKVSGCGPESFYNPLAIAVDSSGRVWVSDQTNHRVVGFDNPFDTDLSADHLVGQTSWTGCSPNMGGAISAQTLYTPGGIFLDSAGALWVADSENHRVLRFPSPSGVGAAADLVVGQPDFITNSANYPSLGPKSLNYPSDVLRDASGNLYISDSGNNRVLFYDTSDLTLATRVFGQMDNLYTNEADIGSTVSAHSLNGPGFLEWSQGMLFVSCGFNNRVLGYYQAGSNTSDTIADLVFGQNGCFSCGGYVSGAEPTPLNFSQPQGLHIFDNDKLLVTDSQFNRILTFYVPLPPVVRSAVYMDRDATSSVSSGDWVILRFSRALEHVGDPFTPGDFLLTRTGDSLGIGMTAWISNLQPHNLIIRLGISPSLVIAGNTSVSSHIDISTSGTHKLVELFSGMPASTSIPKDILNRFTPPPEEYFGPDGGSIELVDDPDAFFTKHKLYLPPGVEGGNILFALDHPEEDIPYLAAVKVSGSSEAYITLEFPPDLLDDESGFLLKFVRIAVLVEVEPGVWEPRWRNVPIEVDLENHTFTVKLGDLYDPYGGNGQGGILYGIDGDLIIADARNLVDENTITIGPQPGGSVAGRESASICLTPGPDCIYTEHSVCIYDYDIVASGGYDLTIRQADSSEREGFPENSGAIFVIESAPDLPSDASFDITVQYYYDADPDLTDTLTLEGEVGLEAKMRLVKLNETSGEFEFVEGYDSVEFNGNSTLTTTGLTGLTDDGSAVYGLAVNPDADTGVLSAKSWMMYE